MPSYHSLFVELAQLDSLLSHIRRINLASPRELSIQEFDLKSLIDSAYDTEKQLFAKRRVRFYNQTKDIALKADKLACFKLLSHLLCHMVRQIKRLSFININAQVYNHKMVVIYVESNGNYPNNPDIDHINQWLKPAIDIESALPLENDLLMIYRWTKAMQGSIQVLDTPVRQGYKFCLILPGKTTPMFSGG